MAPKLANFQARGGAHQADRANIDALQNSTTAAAQALLVSTTGYTLADTLLL